MKAGRTLLLFQPICSVNGKKGSYKQLKQKCIFLEKVVYGQFFFFFLILFLKKKKRVTDHIQTHSHGLKT